MKRKIFLGSVLASLASSSYAASNVTLYGQMDIGVVAGKAKHSSATFQERSGFTGMSRWGIKGTEDLGNGYRLSFTLEEGFTADDGAVTAGSGAFTRESILRLNGPFGTVAMGRMGALGFAQSTAILRGWAFGTSWGASAWSVGNVHFGRLNNAVNYVTPSFSGLTLHATYSNGTAADDNKWSDNAHYYGVGAKYTAHNIDASIIFEAKDNKGVALLEEKQKALYHITAGGTYNFNGVKPGVIYQYATQEDYYHQHAFGLSVTSPLAGGSAKLGAKYLLRKYDSHYVDLAALSEKKASVWTVGAGYEYPFSKRTNLWTYAGYADGAKGWKNEADVNYNGWQVGLGLLHKF